MTSTIPLDYAPPDAMLAGQTVLITGAAQGIGRAVARGAAASGATVVLLDRVVPKLESLYDEITAAGGPEPAIYPMNLLGAEPPHYEDVAARISENFGALDAMVHCAATLDRLCPIEIFPLDEWARSIQVNLNAAFLLTRACLPLLRARDPATIVFSTADVGRDGQAYWGAYAVSNAGLEAFAKVLAEEVEANTALRVNTLDPGPVRTGLRAVAFPSENTSTALAPAQVAPAYLYLLGPEGRKHHGQALSAGQG